MLDDSVFVMTSRTAVHSSVTWICNVFETRQLFLSIMQLFGLDSCPHTYVIYVTCLNQLLLPACEAFVVCSSIEHRDDIISHINEHKLWYTSTLNDHLLFWALYIYMFVFSQHRFSTFGFDNRRQLWAQGKVTPVIDARHAGVLASSICLR